MDGHTGLAAAVNDTDVLRRLSLLQDKPSTVLPKVFITRLAMVQQKALCGYLYQSAF